MRKIILSLIVITSFFQYSAFSQNLTDIVRWSTIDPAGSGRTLGVNNAFGAMGGDYMSTYINPAGIGDFKKGEFVFSPSLIINKANSYLDADPNNREIDKLNRFTINNVAFVIANYRPNRNFTSSNFSFGFSRTADFNNRTYFKGKSVGTITEMFAEKANGLTEDQLDDFIAFPAFFTGAIFDFDKNNIYETDFAQDDLLVTKEQNKDQRGSINELAFTWAGEYKNKFNVGLTVGIPFANFEETKTYRESDPNNEIATFNFLEYTESLNTTGVGINTKLGFLYKASPKFRLGMAFHSPTWFRLTDDYSTSLTYSYDNVVNTYPPRGTQNPITGNFKYKITNPWKAIGSIGTIYKAGDIKGFINLDLEYIDYTASNYNGTAYTSDPGEITYTNEVNRDILNRLNNGVNIKLGTELAYENIRFRAGYNRLISAFNADDFHNNSYAFGLGFREDKFYIDFGLRWLEQNSAENVYSVIDASRDALVQMTNNKTIGVLTLGFKF